MMKRLPWIVFGVMTQLLFLATVARLYPFLRGGGGFHGWLSTPIGPSSRWFLKDGALAIQFAVAHSVLLLPRVRKHLSAWIPSALYGCVFSVATCAGLLLAIEAWQPSNGAIWRLSGTTRLLTSVAFLLSWAALVYSLWLTGLGYQTGFTPWWAWARGREAPRRAFKPKGAYLMLRHPVYLSFLGLIWFNPEMTYDRATLAIVWTVHIFVGSYLKDRRLVHYVGEAYRSYQRRVPGYPFIPFGPLGTLPASRTDG